jgi:hypothetical protein
MVITPPWLKKPLHRAQYSPLCSTHRQIQQFLGHMNIRTTGTYRHELQIDHDILNAFDGE